MPGERTIAMFVPANAASTIYPTAVSTSSSIAFTPVPGAFSYNTARVVNLGAVTATIAFGGSSVVAAAASGMPIPAGGPPEVFGVGQFTHMATIAATGTTTLGVTFGGGS
jgi:hypothetical protein